MKIKKRWSKEEKKYFIIGIILVLVIGIILIKITNWLKSFNNLYILIGWILMAGGLLGLIHITFGTGRN